MNKLLAVFVFIIFLLICIVITGIIEDRMKKGFLKTIASGVCAIIAAIGVVTFFDYVFCN